MFGAGQYAPTTGRGLQLLAHELTHTIQQEQAQAKSHEERPSGQMSISADQVEAHVHSIHTKEGAFTAHDYLRTNSELQRTPSRSPTLPDDRLDYELTDEDFNTIDEWVASSYVRGTKLTGQLQEDLNAIARGIFCRRVPLEEVRETGDPIIIMFEEVIERDPRYQPVRHRVEIALRNRAASRVSDPQAAIDQNRQLLTEDAQIIAVREILGLSPEPLIDEEFVGEVALWQMLQGSRIPDIDGVLGAQTAGQIRLTIQSQVEQLQRQIRIAEVEGEDISVNQERLTRLEAIAAGFLSLEQGITESVLNDFTATVMAEVPGPHYGPTILIYRNLILNPRLGIEGGLLRSEAYEHREDQRLGRGFRFWMMALGALDEQSQGLPPSTWWCPGRSSTRECFDNPPAPILEKPGGLAFFRNLAQDTKNRVRIALTTDPIPQAWEAWSSWTMQGSLNDLNGSGAAWEMNRQYYWLQVRGQVREECVRIVGTGRGGRGGKNTVFAKSGRIASFFHRNPRLLPENVTPVSQADIRYYQLQPNQLP